MMHRVIPIVESEIWLIKEQSTGTHPTTTKVAKEPWCGNIGFVFKK